MARVNLFILGAMKSGTTSLHNIIDKHPDIFMSLEKEPMFFSRNINWKERIKDYEDSNFQGFSKTSLYYGESSTEYSKMPTYSCCAGRIMEYNPKAKFIYILRDPLERAVSEYRFQFVNGWETKSLLEAIIPGSSYFNHSDYFMQIEPYIQSFGRQSILFLSFSDLKKTPQKIMDEICDFLVLKRHILNKPNDSDDYKSNVTAQTANIYKQDSFSYKLYTFMRLNQNFKKIMPLRLIRIFKKLMAKDTLDFNSEKFVREEDQFRSQYREQFDSMKRKIEAYIPSDFNW